MAVSKATIFRAAYDALAAEMNARGIPFNPASVTDLMLKVDPEVMFHFNFEQDELDILFSDGSSVSLASPTTH